MIQSGGWTRNHTKLIGGLQRLARFLSGKVYFFVDDEDDVFVAEKDSSPGRDVRLVSIKIFDCKGDFDDIVARVLEPREQFNHQSDDEGGEG